MIGECRSSSTCLTFISVLTLTHVLSHCLRMFGIVGRILWSSRAI